MGWRGRLVFAAEKNQFKNLVLVHDLKALDEAVDGFEVFQADVYKVLPKQPETGKRQGKGLAWNGKRVREHGELGQQRAAIQGASGSPARFPEQDRFFRDAEFVGVRNHGVAQGVIQEGETCQ